VQAEESAVVYGEIVRNKAYQHQNLAWLKANCKLLLQITKKTKIEKVWFPGLTLTAQ
jgi:hypothetical protein